MKNDLKWPAVCPKRPGIFCFRAIPSLLACAVALTLLLGCMHGSLQSSEPAAAPRMEMNQSDSALGASTAAEQLGGGLAQEPHEFYGVQHGAKTVVSGDDGENLPASDVITQPGDNNSSEVTANRNPLLIYQAYLGLAVFHVDENLDSIEERSRAFGGYLVARSASSITVRVPAEKFRGMVAEILLMGEVYRRDVSAQDVTAEFTDIQIRLKNALAVRERLVELLARANQVEEALQVEKQLGRLSEEIERMKGRLKLLGELSSYSTISVEFSERSSRIKSRVTLPFEWLDELGLHNLLEL